MGLNIVVEDFSQKDEYGCHPDVPENEWDFIRHQGDSEITGLLGSFGLELNGDVDDRFFRPVCFDNLRIAVGAFENYIGVNKGRWLGLVDLLKNNPSYWVYFSY